MRSFPRSAVQIIIILTILGSMFLVQTNSRSSILIKEAVYVGGIALALLVAAIGIMIDGRIASERISRSLIVSFVLLILWMIFRHYSGVQSVNASKYMYSIIALGALVFLIAATFTENARNAVLWILVASTSVLSVYAILQSMGITIFRWDAGLIRMARSSGTMGNANLLGSFSMAMLPVGSGFLLSRSKLQKFRFIPAALFALLCTGAMIASKTRGSLIGLIAIAVFLSFVPFIRKNAKRLVPLLLVFLILIGGSVLLLGNRMDELASIETGTLQVRKLIWSSTLSMVMSNPILGYGPGSFQIVFPQFRNPSYFLLGVSHNTLHAHCEYLEILGDTGIIGLLLWIFIAYSIFRIVSRKRESDNSDVDNHHEARNWLVPGIIAGIVALLAEATVSVALRWPISALLLALFTGLLLASIPSRFTPVKGAVKYGTAAIILSVFLFLGAVALPDYLSAMRSGKELFMGKDMYLVHIQSNMENAVNAAAEWQTSGNPDAAQRALYYYNSAIHAADSSMAWCEKCVETNHSELGGWYALGSAYISASRLYQQISPPLTNILRTNGIYAEDRHESDRYMLLGLAAYDSLTSMAPDYAEIHNNLALVWINIGYPDSALAELRDAWDLHAHNRYAYADKVSMLNILTKSTDGVYLHWQIIMQTVEKLLSIDGETDRGTRLFRRLMFDYGTTFLRYRESTESLQTELISMLNSTYPEIASVIEEATDTQIEHMQKGLDILQQFEDGDTAAVLVYLNSLSPDELAILPLQRALQGRLQMAEGDIEGMQTIIDILKGFGYTDFDDLSAWPMDASQMMAELNEALISTGLDDSDERSMYLSSELIALRFDRRIFEMIIFIESSPSLREASTDIRNDLEILWERIGGPLYCFMRIRDDLTGAPLMREASLFHNSYSEILALEEQDSLNAELVLFELQWLYVLFCSSYNGVPHYSTVQGAQTVSLIADAREKLVPILGESETQYQIASMLNDLADHSILCISGEFSYYTEALRNDLIMGRITRPDLP